MVMSIQSGGLVEFGSLPDKSGDLAGMGNQEYCWCQFRRALSGKLMANELLFS